MRKLVFGFLFLVTVVSVSPVVAVERVATRPGLLRQMVKNTKAMVTGTLSVKSGNTLTVTSGASSYSVLVDGNTQLRRRFWGKATLDEMSVGDSLNVIGKWTDDVHSTIQAKLVRDSSIQKRFGVFVGTVTSLTGTGWIMSTINRGPQTVTATQSAVLVGHKVRVRGLWDNKLNTITEVSHVKDYSL